MMNYSNSLSEKIEIYVSGRNFKDLDTFSKSDPYVKVSYRRDSNQKNYTILGRTETKKNDLNPDYAKVFGIDYLFQSRQDIRFDVYDDDGNGDNDDYIGYVQTTVGALMGARSQTSILDLKNNQSKPIQGKLIIRCQTIKQSNQYFKLKIRAEKLQNVDSFFDFWDKSDPYIKFLKIRDDNTYLQVKRTEVIQNNLNPSWNPVEIQAAKLLNPNKPGFKLQIWDSQQDGKDQFIGEVFVRPEQLKNGALFQLTNPKIKSPGTLLLQFFQVIKKPSFVDYLRGGLELNMIVAIDFTGSNGVPSQPTSLHYLNPTNPNQYQMAIASISQILLNYDTDKRIPSFGFGGKPIINGSKGQVSHCFVLSGNMNEVEACGVQHLMLMYRNALTHVQLAGPTYFGPLIQETMRLALVCKQKGSTAYQTLLIITDGEIHDMDQTIDKLVQATDLPLSIIIVGVGSANFDNMSRLDGDNGLFGSNGVRAKRDIVQFVPFRDVKMDGSLLARELLAELPSQVVQYMEMIGKPPGQFVPVNIEQMIQKS